MLFLQVCTWSCEGTCIHRCRHTVCVHTDLSGVWATQVRGVCYSLGVVSMLLAIALKYSVTIFIGLARTVYIHHI